MTTLPRTKPLPEVSEQNRPFWDGLRVHEFRAPRCTDCGDFGWIPYPACRTCFGTDLEWVTLSGAGTVFSYTVVHRGPGPFQDDVPYVLALVELAEQPRPMLVLAQVDVAPADVHIGQRVHVTYDDVAGEDITLYRFAPS